MKRSCSLLMALILVFSLSACKAGKAEINKAEHFMTGLASLKDADPVTEMDSLIVYSASVLNIPGNAFDLRKGWEKKHSEYERNTGLYGSDGVLSLYLNDGKVDKLTYTFSVGGTKTIYDAAEDLTRSYGKPDVTLNSDESKTQSDVLQAINQNSDPDLRYCYEWTVNLEQQNVYIYLAYYFNDGTNFAYLVVSNPGRA